MASTLRLPASFSPAHNFSTEVPFSGIGNGDTKDRGNVNLSVCSEYTEHVAPIQPFGACKALKLISDTVGQAVVFAIDQDQHLACLVRVRGGRYDWKLVDITPEAINKVVALDLVQDQEKNVNIAIAAESADGLCSVHHASFPVPEIAMEKDQLVGFKPHDIKWTQVTSNAGAKKVSYLLVGPKPVTPQSSAPFLITVGSEEQQDTTATHYTIDPSPDVSEPWSTFAFSRDADKIIEIQSATWDNRRGIYVLFEQNGETECVVDLFDDQGNYSHTQVILTQACGKIRHMYSNLNLWGATDLFFAAEKGLGFVNTQADTAAVQLFAQNASYKQVIAAEALDPENSETQCKFTIFAVSDADELHFIHGTRQFKGNKTVFNNSGFPIRTGVQLIAARVGEQTRTDDLVYLDKAGTSLKYLMRDPITTCWRESSLSFDAPSRARTFPAFVTTISLKDGLLDPAPSGIPVTIASAPIHVTVNNRAHALSREPTTVVTDAFGQITIVTPADDTLAAPVFEVTVSNKGKSATQKVFAGQRVMERLCNIKSGSQLANARAVDGGQVFSDIERQELSQGFDASDDFFQNLPSMISTIDDDTKPLLGDIAPLKEMTIGGMATPSNAMEWLSEKWRDVSPYLGDALEWLRDKVKSTLKFAFKVVGKAIKFVFQAVGKVFSVVVDTLDALFPALTSFLRNVVQVGREKLLKLLGYRFDLARIKQTQDVLIATFHAANAKTTAFMKVNKQAIRAGFDLARDTIDDYIKDERPTPEAQPGTKSWLSWLLDNPIFKFLMRFNPFSILIEAATEAIAEEFGDTIKFPDLSAIAKIFTQAIPSGVEKQLVNAMRLMESVQSHLGSIRKDPKSSLAQLRGIIADSFWTLFDAIQEFILTVWEIATLVFEQLFELFGGTWKIPGVTSVFERFTGQEFSFLSVTSFMGATLLNIFVGDENTLPFDKLGRPDEAINRIADEDLDLRRLFKEAISKLASPQHSQQALVVNMHAMESRVASKPAIAGATFSARSVQPNIMSNSMPKSNTANGGKSESKKPEQAKKEKIHRNPEEYKRVKHQYHTFKQSLATGIGISRAISAIAEVPLAFTEAAAGQLGANVVHKTSSGIGAFFSCFVAIGRVIDMAHWMYVRGQSEDFKEELDEDFFVHLSAHLISVAGSIGAAGCLLKSVIEADVAPLLFWQTTGNVILNVSCAIDVAVLHLYVEWDEDSRQAKQLRIADWTELVGCVAGLGTVGLSVTAHHIPEPQTKSAVAVGAVGCAATDAILSLVSLIITITNASAYKDH